MYRNVFKKDYLTVLNADGPSPLSQWQPQIKAGFVRRVWDRDLSALAIEALSTNVTNCALETKGELGVNMPFLVLAVKNMNKYFTFHVTILDDCGMRRRFRFSNFQTRAVVGVFDCSFPLCLNPETPWNLIRIDLQRLTSQAFQTVYLETYKISIHANCRVRRVYFCKILLPDDELPKEYSIQPRPRTSTQRRVTVERKEKSDSPAVPPPSPSHYEELEDEEGLELETTTQATEEETEPTSTQEELSGPPTSIASEEEGEGEFTLILQPPDAEQSVHEAAAEEQIEAEAATAEIVPEPEVEDLIIFPDDCEFKRVDLCTTGRVFVLKFKSSSRKLFFWVQEPKTDKDEENCKKVNEMLNNPPTAGSTRSGGGTPDELHNLLGSMSQQQLMQLFGSFGGSGGSGGTQLPSSLTSLLGTMGSRSSSARTTASADKTSASETPAKPASAPATTASTPTTSRTSTTTPASQTAPGGAILLSDLQRYLSTMRPASSAATPASPSVDVDLSEALLNSESIQGVLDDPSLVRELSPHLPEVDTDEPGSERLRSTLLSPQFQQAVSMFSAALSSGQIGPVVQQFRVGESAVHAAVEGNMEEFVKALEKTNITNEKKEEVEKGKEEGKQKKDEDGSGNSKDGDEKMSEG